MYNPFQPITGDYEYLIDTMGKSVKIDGETQNVLMQMSNPNGKYADRIIQSLSPLSSGSLVEYNNSFWLIMSDINDNRYEDNRYKGVIKKCNILLKWQQIPFVRQTWAILEDSTTIGVSYGRDMNLAQGKFKLTLPKNQYTDAIELNKTFLLFNNKGKVSHIDKTKEGIIQLLLDLDTIGANDRFDLGIADYQASTITLTITTGESSQLQKGNTLQLATSVAINGTVDNTYKVLFKSDNETVATVDATGLITSKAVGSAIITASLEADSTVTDTYAINVVDAPPAPSYNVTITSTSTTPNEIKDSQTKTYNANVYNNSVQITDGSQPVTWSLWDDTKTTTTTLALIDSQTGTSCVVKNNKAMSGYVQLCATLNSNSTIKQWIRIQMKALF
ncbi:Ig-like domain-containing protein [Aneurinibacillus tyrosinisolvens]|uniref:Ig-like domain-containing protein n=1 Tax=Aneurinibacillus tyrosinisolvens TaxID=1443435 RepID=UPI00063F3561|nr:Ig-like domain-containing protein [Aneurinibacillus tyrosinisolvens]